MRISVFGLGYVGAVTMGCLARGGHHVFGVDVNEAKLESFRRGVSPIVEPGLAECIADGHARGLFEVTTDHAAAALATDLSIVCVGTPSRGDGGLNLRYVESVSVQIANAVRNKSSTHHLVYRSTMLPGSTRVLVEELMEDLCGSGRLEVYFFPEFLREGSAVRDFESPPLSVIGSRDGSPVSADLQCLIGENTRVVPWESAEMLKYACNAFHAAKVVFANEMGRIGKRVGIDATAVMELFCEDRALNLSEYYLRPGNPFGGSCLPKDVRALSRFAVQLGIETPMVSNLIWSNRLHAEALRETIQRLGGGDVAILGLSFKKNTDDLRESPMVQVVRDLIPSGRSVRIFDPALNPEKLTGANMQQINERLPGFSKLLCSRLEEAISASGLIIVSQSCVDIDELRRYVTKRHTVLDVNGWRELRSLPSRYEGFLW